MIDRDGSGLRDLTGDLPGLAVFGANGWSPDGSFVYFGAGDDSTTAIFRVNVKTATSERLTGTDIQAFAPALSPDGTLVSFMVWAGAWWDVHLIGADGTGEHRLLEHATNDGWSGDGSYVLAEWHQPTPGAPNGGLALVRPDGTEPRVALPFDWVCATNPDNGQPRCLNGASWGGPTP